MDVGLFMNIRAHVLKEAAMKTVAIREFERGLVFQNGNYLKLLKPGKYWFFRYGIDVVVYDMNKPFITIQNLNMLLKNEDLKDELNIVDVADNELVIRYEDNRFADVLRPGKYAYWKELKTYRFDVIDTNDVEVGDKVPKSLLEKSVISSFMTTVDIASYECGLLFFNRQLQRELKPGTYRFWKTSTKVTVEKVDMRQKQLDMVGQEIMTLDKVPLRMNFVLRFEVANAQKVALKIKGFEEQLYIKMQLVLREYVGGLKLDEVLLSKEKVGEFVLNALRKNETEFGIRLLDAGVKDVILPGDIKEILNKVLKAEKNAQANTIMRREETSATRSLLNTAKLMDENPTLFRLKELEYIEKIVQKIDTISLNSNGQLMGQLTKLLGQ